MLKVSKVKSHTNAEAQRNLTAPLQAESNIGSTEVQTCRQEKHQSVGEEKAAIRWNLSFEQMQIGWMVHR